MGYVSSIKHARDHQISVQHCPINFSSSRRRQGSGGILPARKARNSFPDRRGACCGGKPSVYPADRAYSGLDLGPRER